jgi:hypothetical protein
MMTCEQYQALLLDHLYDVLEPNEVRALGEHLPTCAACQAALVRARSQKDLLAAAARSEFAGVQFKAPAVIEAAPVLPLPVRHGWVRWAVAAAVLLAIGGISISATWYGRQLDLVAQARSRAEQLRADIQRTDQEHQVRVAQATKVQQDRVQQATKEREALQREYQQLAGQRQGKLIEVQQTIAAKQLHLSVIGPPNPEPGAPNQYQIAVRTPDQRPARAHLSATLVDQDKRVVYEEKDMPTEGNYRLNLPRDLPLKPDTQLTLEVRARGENAQQGQVREHLQLAAPVYVTHLATDKPMYQPGEVVHFRSLTLERFSLKPAQEDLHLVFNLFTPTGEQVRLLDGLSRTAAPVVGPDKQPVRGIGAGDYQLDPGAPGGEYKLTISEAQNRFLPQERKFLVNQYEKPRLNKELEFTRKSYGPGDEVVAACKAAKVEGGTPVAFRPVSATILVDGKTYGADGNEGGSLALKTDGVGGVQIKFKLPARIERGSASLSVTFNEGSVETLVRPIPIVLKKLQVEFFPEGGDLVAGVPNRVYFQARTTLDKPAELKGRIVDEDGQVMSDAQTLNDPTQPEANQGMGLVAFTPLFGKKYELKIDAPAGIEGKYALPEVQPDGVVLTVPTGVTTDKDPIKVVLRSAKADRQLLVGVYCRGRLMAHQRVAAPKARATEVELQSEGGAGGVFRVTVFEEQGNGDRLQLTPRAERLIYRVPVERLKLEVQPDKKQYVPGDRVTLRYQATDEKSQPAPAVVMVAVVDKSVIKLADEKTFRSMPTHFLLTSEVRRPEDLEHADFLLGSHPRAAEALDLLLGTQGWRRFAEQNPDDFRNKNPREAADRFLVAAGRLMPATLGPQMTDFDNRAVQKVLEDFQPRLAPVQEKLAKLDQVQQKAAEVEPYPAAEITRLTNDWEASRKQYGVAAAKLGEYQGYLNKARTTGLPILALGLLVVGVAGLAVGLVRKNLRQAMPFLATAVCSVLLFLWVASNQVIQQGAGDQPAVAFGPPINTETRLHAAQGGDERLRQAVEAKPEAGEAQAWGRAGAANGAAKGAGRWADKLAEEERTALPLAAVPPPGPGAPPAPAAQPAPPVNQPVPPAFFGDDKAKNFAFRGDNQKAMKKDGKGEGQGGLEGAQLARRAMPADAKAKRMAGLGVPALAGKPMAQPLNQLAKEAKQMNGQADMALRQLEQLKRPVGVGGGARGLRAGAGFGGEKDMDRLELREEGFLAQPPQSPPEPFVVREYAHQRTTSEGAVRSDFTETLFWNPVLVLPDGKGESSFSLCDSVTTFQVLVAGNTANGRIGALTTEVEARLPLTVEPKLPIEITAGDRIDVPLTIANNTDGRRAVSVRVRPTNLALEGAAEDEVALQPNERTRRLYHLKPTIPEGRAELRFEGVSGSFTDTIIKSFPIVPEGFPVVGAQSDVLEKTARADLFLPETWIPGTLKYQVAVYPSTLADLQKGLEAMLREPCGCFEQTSTSNYPNLLILDYIKETDQAKPDVARHAQELLGRGYQKLTSFECLNTGKNQREGYEWFGGTAPAHEALTAYGLLQFRDMTRVYEVDKAMIERTRSYLMSRKDGKGGFARNPAAIDTFGRAPDNITNAYIVWALTDSGKDDDVTKELAALVEQAGASKDPYFLALVANSLINRDRTDEALALLKRLAEAQQADGHLDAAQTSITGSGGRDLQIETTAMTLLAWLKVKRHELFNVNVQKAVKWIGQQRGGYGGFGSTQSTILALKALIAYAHANKKTAEAGDLILYVGNEPVTTQHFAAGVEDAVILTLPDPEKHLKPGKNEIRVEVTGKNVFPYTAAWSYQSLKPASAAKCPVALTTRLDRATAEEGNTVRLTVHVENQSGKGQGMTVAIVGLPAGLTLPEDMKQLKDLARLRNNGTEPGPISAWETRGREVILYWRDMAPDKKIDVDLDLICRVPGEYRGPASRAYLYYNADHKCWAEPLRMSIKAKTE